MRIQVINNQTNLKRQNLNFTAGEVVIKDANLIKAGLARNFDAESALKKLFVEFLFKKNNFRESLAKAPEGVQIIPRIGGSENHFLIDVKRHGVTKDTYGTTPIEDIKKEESIERLAKNLSHALDTRI